MYSVYGGLVQDKSKILGRPTDHWVLHITYNAVVRNDDETLMTSVLFISNHLRGI